MKKGVKRTWDDLPGPLRFFWGLNVLLSGSCALIMRADRYLFHGTYPRTSPFILFDHWIDFTCFQERFQHFHQLDVFSNDPSFSYRFMYPAPMAVLYQSFYLLGRHSLGIFLFITMMLVAFLGAILGKAMVRQGAGVPTAALFLSSAICFSYPFWFTYMLGNMEVCVFLIVAAGFLAYVRGYLYVAAGLIGLAASVKIFPFVYLALFLGRKKYPQFAFGVAAAVAANVSSLWLLCPSIPIAYRGIKSGLLAFRNLYILPFRPVETGFDHSIFGFMKSVGNLLHEPVMPGAVLTGYLAVAAIGGISLYFLRIRHLPQLNQIVCLCALSILLPPTSHDYTLIELYVPWGLMVLYALRTANIRPRGLMLAFVCFAVAMSAESELIYKVGYSGQLKAIALVVLLLTALKCPWDSTEDRLSPSQPGLRGERLNEA